MSMSSGYGEQPILRVPVAREQRKLAAIVAGDVVGVLPPHGPRRERDVGAPGCPHRRL
jgi:hypothetical protein